MLEITIRGLVAVFWLACLVQNWWRSIKASFTLCGLIQHWTAALSLRPCGAKIMSKLVVTIDVWSSQAGVNIGNDIVFWNGEIIVENERSKNVNKISRIFYWFFLNLKHVNFLWKTRKKRKKKGKHHSGFFTFVRICDLSSFWVNHHLLLRCHIMDGLIVVSSSIIVSLVGPDIMSKLVTKGVWSISLITGWSQHRERNCVLKWTNLFWCYVLEIFCKH